jgi:phenylpropionate dioxygenase-like ring-hydroxylating dioxygenase large terminal subunit
MDRDALDRSLARRLVDHIEVGTTDLADGIMEVPVEVYTSADRLRREVDALFRGQPLVLCLSGALAEPGAYATLDVCGTPILVTRDGEGRAHALLNACRHRGVRVADGCGTARRFTCPFHNWTYDAGGALVGLPVASAFEDMCRDDKGLVELPVAEGYGLVVGRLQPGGPVDVDEYLGPELAAELELLDFADWTRYGEPHLHPVEANWKVTLDTYRENYHFDFLHRDTLASYAYGGVLTFDAFGPHLRNCSAIRSIDELRGVPESEWVDPARHTSYQYSLFPNTCMTFDSRHIELWQILPDGVDRSIVLHTAYERPGLPPEEHAKLVDMAPWICETVVDGQDFWVAGRATAGLRTGLTGTVVFGRNEPAPQHLHRGFSAALGE